MHIPIRRLNWGGGKANEGPVVGASANVVISDVPVGTRASYSGMRVEEPGVQEVGSVAGVAFVVPADQVALQALQTNVEYGLWGYLGMPATAGTERIGGGIAGMGWECGELTRYGNKTGLNFNYWR